MTRTIQGRAAAWLTEYTDPERLKANGDGAVAALVFTGLDSKMQTAGWTYVGEANVTVEAVDEDTLIANKVESLQAEIQKSRADSEAHCNALQRKINTLLAITNEVPA